MRRRNFETENYQLLKSSWYENVATRALPLLSSVSLFLQQISVENSKLLRHRASAYRQTRDDRSTISRKSGTCVALSNDRSSITKKDCNLQTDEIDDSMFLIARRGIRDRSKRVEFPTRERTKRKSTRSRMRKASHLILNKDLLDDGVSMAATVTKVDQSWAWLGLNSIDFLV